MRRIRKSRLSFGFHRESIEIVEKPSILECLFNRGRGKDRLSRDRLKRDKLKRDKWQTGKEIMEEWLR